MTAVRVALIDDDQTIHEVVDLLFRDTDDFLLVGRAFRGSDAITMIRQTEPDIVLMDVMMPGLSGPDATREVRKAFPTMVVLALSSYREYDIIREMIDGGASGYIVKDALVEDLRTTIQALLSGQAVFSSEVARTLIDPPTPNPDVFGLTDRELQVLREIASGHNNGQVAQALSISVPTVSFHIKNILEKLNVETRSEALVLAAKAGLI